jgi:hypothetical protein
VFAILKNGGGEHRYEADLYLVRNEKREKRTPRGGRGSEGISSLPLRYRPKNISGFGEPRVSHSLLTKEGNNYLDQVV